MRSYHQIFSILIVCIILCACKTKHKFPIIEKTSEPISVDQIINEIANNNTIESEYVGIAGSPSTQLARYKMLKQIASDEELISFTNHENPVVKYYSFRALVRRNSTKIFDILLKYMYDTTTQVASVNGCLLDGQTLRYSLIGALYSEDNDLTEFHLNEDQKKIIDSILAQYPDPLMRPANR